MADTSGKKTLSLGKILLCIGIAGTVLSLVLLFIGIFSANNIDDSGYVWLSIVGFIVIGVSFIITAAGAIAWYLESVADRIRARNRDASSLQSDYNDEVDKL
jgi:hypothetical protein